MPEPLVSIVIITWNRLQDIKLTLGELKKIIYPNYEIILVDNGSSDGTVEYVMEQHPDVRTVRLEENIGIGARNIGMLKARGEYIVLLDDDSYPLPDTLTKMVEKFERDGALSVVAFSLIDSGGLPITGKFDKFTDAPEVDGGRDSWYFYSCGAGLKKEHLETSGLLQSKLFFGHGEEELSLRIIDSGGKIRYYPDTIAVHRETNVNRPLARFAYYSVKNCFYLYFHHFNVWEAVLFLFHRLAGGFKYFCLQKMVWKAYFMGLMGGMKELPAILRGRRLLKKSTRDYYWRFFKRMVRGGLCRTLRKECT